MHRIAKWFLMAGLLAFLFSRTALCVVDLDLWHELALAREVMRLGHVPWQDHFAFTPKLDLVVHHDGRGDDRLRIDERLRLGGNPRCEIRSDLRAGEYLLVRGETTWSQCSGRRTRLWVGDCHRRLQFRDDPSADVFVLIDRAAVVGL